MVLNRAVTSGLGFVEVVFDLRGLFFLGQW